MDCVKCKYESLLIDLGYSWETIYDGIYNYRSGGGSRYDNFKRDLSNGATVEVVGKSDQAGETYQDETTDMWVALKVTEPNGQVLYFQKNGVADSYGNVTWGGMLRQVQPVEKTVTVFEPTFGVV